MSTQRFNISTEPSSVYGNNSQTLLPDGTILVVWSEGNSADSSVKMRQLSSTGEPLGKTILVADGLTKSGGFVSVTAGLDGTVVVAFSDEDDGDEVDTDAGIYFQRFDVSLTKLGGPVLTNTLTEHSQSLPSITTLADGGFIITYQSLGNDPTNGQDALFQRYDAFGSAVGPETSVTNSLANTQNYPDIVALPDGGWVALYSATDTTLTSNALIRFQRFDVNGSRIGSEISLTTNTLSDVFSKGLVLSNGNIVVTYSELDTGNDRYDTWAMIVDQNGAVLTPAVSLSAAVTEDFSVITTPVQLTDGRIVVSWTSLTGTEDEDKKVVYYQILSEDGVPIGTPQSVGGTVNLGGAASIVALEGGGFMFASTNENQEITGQIFLQASDQADYLTMASGGTLRALNGADFIHGSSDTDIIYGGADADHLYGYDGDDLLYGGGGTTGVTQFLFGGAGNDLLTGGNKTDNLRGGNDSDILRGKDGNDLLQGGDGDDFIQAGIGDDSADGGSGKDDIRGGQGDDTLDGGNSADRLSGGVGNDLITGGGGADTIIGGLGDDEMTGNLGRDEFEFNQSNFGNDVITDWEDTRDTIVINIAGVAFGDVSITDIGAHALVEFGGGEVIVVGGGGVLTADDFSF